MAVRHAQFDEPRVCLIGMFAFSCKFLVFVQRFLSPNLWIHLAGIFLRVCRFCYWRLFQKLKNLSNITLDYKPGPVKFDSLLSDGCSVCGCVFVVVFLVVCLSLCLWLCLSFCLWLCLWLCVCDCLCGCVCSCAFVVVYL